MMMSTIADILDRAAARLSKPGAWLGGPPYEQPFASDATRKEWLQPDDERATCWCLYGAINRESPDRDARAAAADAVRRVVGTFELAEWNHAPRRKQNQVVAKLREAAELARHTESRNG